MFVCNNLIRVFSNTYYAENRGVYVPQQQEKLRKVLIMMKNCRCKKHKSRVQTFKKLSLKTQLNLSINF